MTVSFPILGAPAHKLNMNQRPHWRTRHRLTKAWRGAAYTSAVAALGTAPSARQQPPSFVRVDFPVRDPGRRRDPHNWGPTEKAIVDGLVDAGLWPDDTPDQVLVMPCRFVAVDVPLALATPTVHLHPYTEGMPT